MLYDLHPILLKPIYFFSYFLGDDDDDGETDQGNPVERSVLVIFEKFVRETRAGHLKVNLINRVLQ